MLRKPALSVSNSEIQCFKRCRRQWWFKYYRGLRPRATETVGSRPVGTRVHACLAAYYNDHDAGRVAENALTVHDVMVAQDIARCPEQEADIRKEADLSRAMLEGYFEWLQDTGADEGLYAVAAEQAVFVDVTAPSTRKRVRVMGKLDLRVRRQHDDADMFLDHKTVQEFTTPTKTLHLDEQMLMYHWLVEQQEQGDRVGGAIYNMIRKVKRTAAARPPFYERFTVHHSPAEIQSFVARTLTTLDEMIRLRRALDKAPARAASLAYPSPNRNCSWDCDFFAVCPLVDRPDLGGGENLIETLYEPADPYARYEETPA